MTNEQIQSKIEEYHQAHFWENYPSGGAGQKEWVLNAIREKIIEPLEKKIEELTISNVKG